MLLLVSKETSSSSRCTLVMMVLLGLCLMASPTSSVDFPLERKRNIRGGRPIDDGNPNKNSKHEALVARRNDELAGAPSGAPSVSAAPSTAPTDSNALRVQPAMSMPGAQQGGGNRRAAAAEARRLADATSHKEEAISINTNNEDTKTSQEEYEDRTPSPLVESTAVPQHVSPQSLFFEEDDDDLMTFSSKFYIYDDHAIAQSKLVDKLRALGKAAFDEESKALDHVITDAMAEFNVLEQLKEHPLRTMNPNEAELFIVPTPVTELLLFGCRWEDCLWYDEAFDALAKHPIFRMHHGHKHVLLCFNWLSFNRRFNGFIPALSRSYNLLKNVTVAHHFDPFGAARLAAVKQDSEYDALFPDESPPVTNAFSVGLGLGYDKKTFPMRVVDYETFWNNNTNFMFYHPGDREFAYGTTKYRRAIFEDPARLATALPPSSIGFAIEYSKWLGGLLSSKFCLVIRGDTPHSHALLFAVRAGCIPVVVSDFYQEYAPSFKTSLDIKDCSIVIPEKTFLQAPIDSLVALRNLPEDFLRAKLTNLTRAQRILLPDHPNSLFVPALLREALEASKNQLVPESIPPPRADILEDVAILSGLTVPYRVPSTILVLNKNDETAAGGAGGAGGGDTTSPSTTLLVGVLSKPTNRDARLSIRQTWAENRKGQVFFVVAGLWEVIQQEFYEQGDLIWLDMPEPEDLSLLTYKTQAMFHALNRFGDEEHHHYIMKADDDSYVGVDAIQEIMERNQPGYWGQCMWNDLYRLPSRDPADTTKRFVSTETWPQEHFPVWADGMGYVLSRSLTRCAVDSFPLMNPNLMTGVITENVAMGIVADHYCHVPCRNDEWDAWSMAEDKYTAPLRVEHPVLPGHGDMLNRHWDNMRILKRGVFAEFD